MTRGVILTLKNDPGIHFSKGSLFNVTPDPQVTRLYALVTYCAHELRIYAHELHARFTYLCYTIRIARMGCTTTYYFERQEPHLRLRVTYFVKSLFDLKFYNKI